MSLSINGGRNRELQGGDHKGLELLIFVTIDKCSRESIWFSILQLVLLEWGSLGFYGLLQYLRTRS